MTKTPEPPFAVEIVEDAAARGVGIRFRGPLDVSSAGGLLRRLRPQLRRRHRPDALRIDLSGVTRFDDFGAAVLMEMLDAWQVDGRAVRVHDPAGIGTAVLSRVGWPGWTPGPAGRQRRRRRLVLRLGEGTIRQMVNLKFLVSFVGSVFMAFAMVVRHPGRLRRGDTLDCMEKTGVNAVPIVGLISFLLGLVIAFMSSLQLRQFGASIYVASLVSIAMVSELGPIMTAIVVSGRSGSAYAAEIGTMKINEEIDALVTMGFDPALFLAVPRIIAAVIVVPLLTLFADLFAIAGGLVVGVFVLDLTVSSYMTQTIKILTLFEVVWGLSKSVVFAFLVSWIACLRGFQTRGGADAVGNAATSAVVSGIFLVILFDSAFAIVRSQW